MTTYNIFNHATETGAGQVQSDAPIQLSIVFTPLVSGNITAISFWKDSSDTTTTRQVAIYDPSSSGAGNLSGDIISSSEPTGTSQWVTIPITPFAVTANTAYMAVVHFMYTTGAYSATGSYFGSDKINSTSTLKAYSNAHAITTGAAGNGCFTYFDNTASNTAYTEQSFNSTNYWVDVELTTTGASLVLGDKVLDNGLNYLDTNCDKIFVCSHMPTSYADATSTSALGNYNWGAGNAFPADGAKSGGGRQISSNAITNGSITANGTVAAWAAVDTVNSLLLASGALTGGGAVLSGQTFSLGVLTIGIPNH